MQDMPHCLIHIFARQNELISVTTENNDWKIVHWLWRLPRDTSRYECGGT